MAIENLIESLEKNFGDKVTVTQAFNEVTVETTPENLLEVANALVTKPEWKFVQLIDLCGLDYLAYGQAEWETDNVSQTGFSRGVEAEQLSGARLRFGDETPESTMDGSRFAVTYHLISYAFNQRLRLKVFAESDQAPVIPSVIDIWPVANWYEREAFDLYGIIFEGHTDLRRILTDYGFVGHPFRKDFPLVGHVEMRYDPEKKRVVYEPVSIEPRVLVPRVVRDDNRYMMEQEDGGNS